MDPLTIGALALLLMLVLLVLSIPIGVAMAFSGLLGTAMIIGWKPAFALFGTTAYESTATYSLSVVPLFVLMGAVTARSGLSRELYGAFNTWFGARRGGLALATIGACGAFAAICGSSLATAATMTKVALPEMKKYKYADSLAAGSIAAGGTIGVLIPPSVIMVLYGILTQTSIGDLFIAGIIPGILTVIVFMLTVTVVTHIWPEMGPRGEARTITEKVAALGQTWAIILLFVMVIGGIYFGVFTPTEAAGVGATLAFVISAARGRLTFANTLEAVLETVQTTAMIFTILIGAIALNNLIVFSGIAGWMQSFVGGLDIHPFLVMSIILLIYLALGSILDTLAMVLLTVPIFFPIIITLGFDPVWFGVILVMVVELGLITPPVGMNVFVIKGMAPGIKLTSMYRGVLPFVVAQLLLIIAVFLIPEVATFLPDIAQ